MHFQAAGNFPDTGLYIVKLNGKGKPGMVGLSTFTVQYNTSRCLINIPVLTGTDTSSVDAVFNLQGAPDTCYPVIVAGTYITDFPTGSSETVMVSVQVSVAGNFSINTPEVNRYKFFSSGYLDTGVQKITLKAIGAPLQAGIDIFTLTAGNSVCSFSITALNRLLVNGTDYFPLRTGNYWTYDDLMNLGDTIKRAVTDSITINGRLYYTMHEYDLYGGDNSLMFAKAANDYFQYGPVDMLTNSLKYIPSVAGDIHFLKQNLLLGDSWHSEEYVGNLFSGQPVYLQYDYLCMEGNTALTVNGNSFINVYHIRLAPQIRSSQNFSFNGTNELVDLYYAKGVGLVSLKTTDYNGNRKKEWKLRYWQVN